MYQEHYESLSDGTIQLTITESGRTITTLTAATKRGLDAKLMKWVYSSNYKGKQVRSLYSLAIRSVIDPRVTDRPAIGRKE